MARACDSNFERVYTSVSEESPAIGDADSGFRKPCIGLQEGRTVKTSKGFTLAELLVVVAIIAILAAILFPVIRQAQDTARMRVCASNLKQLGLAFRMYLDDNNGFATPDTPYDSDNHALRPEPLRRYLQERPVSSSEKHPKRLWICPGDNGFVNEPPRWKYKDQLASSYYYCYGAYLANSGWRNRDVVDHTTAEYTPRRPDQWARPSRDLLMADYGANFHLGWKNNDADSGLSYSVKCINMLMLDGHVVVGTSWERHDANNYYACVADNPYSSNYAPGLVRKHVAN